MGGELGRGGLIADALPEDVADGALGVEGRIFGGLSLGLGLAEPPVAGGVRDAEAAAIAPDGWRRADAPAPGTRLEGLSSADPGASGAQAPVGEACVNPVRADVSTFLPNVSSFRRNVSTFGPDVSTFGRNVSTRGPDVSTVSPGLVGLERGVRLAFRGRCGAWGGCGDARRGVREGRRVGVEVGVCWAEDPSLLGRSERRGVRSERGWPGRMVMASGFGGLGVGCPEDPSPKPSPPGEGLRSGGKFKDQGSCARVSRVGRDRRRAGSEGMRRPRCLEDPGGIDGRSCGSGDREDGKVQPPFAQGERVGHRWLS